MKIALHCISYISGNDIPNLHPLWPSIGFNSWSSATLSLISLTPKLSDLARSSISLSVFGRNSCSGGSKSLTVTGRPFMILKISLKSFFWWGNNFSKATFLPSKSFDTIICLTDKILSSSKNICSVLHKPIPSAPKLLATLVSCGVSELVLIFNFLKSSAHFIIVEKYPDMSGLTVGTSPSITLPDPPSIVIVSPSLITKSPTLNSLLS